MAAASKPPVKKPKGKAPAKGGVAAALTRKLGPLPAWGWLTILAVGVWYYRKTHAAATSTTGTTPDSSPQVFGGGFGGFGGGGDSGGGGGDSPPTSPTPSSTTPTLTPGGPGVISPTTGASATNASKNAPPGVAAAVRAVAPTFNVASTAKSLGITAAQAKAPATGTIKEVSGTLTPGGKIETIGQATSVASIAGTSSKPSSTAAANAKSSAAVRASRPGGVTTARHRGVTSIH